MIYAYTAYGLVLHLCFPCSLLRPAAPDVAPDVVVSEGAVPLRLDNPIVEAVSWQAEAGRFLIRGGRRAGRFLVHNAGQVTLQRNPGAEDERLAFVFIHSVLAAILRQRGLLALHASAALTEHGAVVICGASGAGKSTTLSTLIARGAAMLSDDLTALQIGPQGCVEALPGVPELHLCRDAADRVQAANAGQSVMGIEMRSGGRIKVAVQPVLAPPVHAAPLRAIYALNAEGQEEASIRPLRGMERFAALQECVYGPLLPHEHEDRFGIFAAIAEQVALFSVRRPPAAWTAEEIADSILRGDPGLLTAL